MMTWGDKGAGALLFPLFFLSLEKERYQIRQTPHGTVSGDKHQFIWSTSEHLVVGTGLAREEDMVLASSRGSWLRLPWNIKGKVSSRCSFNIITCPRVGEGGLHDRGAGGKPSPHSQTLSFCKFWNLGQSYTMSVLSYLWSDQYYIYIVTNQPGRATDIGQWPFQPRQQVELLFQRPSDRELLLAPRAAQERGWSEMLWP